MKSIKVILSVMMLFVVSSCIYRMENAPPDSDNKTLAAHLGYEVNTKLGIVTKRLDLNCFQKPLKDWVF